MDVVLFKHSCFFKKILELPAFELFACHCRRRVAYIVGPIFDACGQVYGFSCAPPIFWTALTPPPGQGKPKTCTLTFDMQSVQHWELLETDIPINKPINTNAFNETNKCISSIEVGANLMKFPGSSNCEPTVCAQIWFQLPFVCIIVQSSVSV